MCSSGTNSWADHQCDLRQSFAYQGFSSSYFGAGSGAACGGGCGAAMPAGACEIDCGYIICSIDSGGNAPVTPSASSPGIPDKRKMVPRTDGSGINSRSRSGKGVRPQRTACCSKYVMGVCGSFRRKNSEICVRTRSASSRFRTSPTATAPEAATVAVLPGSCDSSVSATNCSASCLRASRSRTSFATARTMSRQFVKAPRIADEGGESLPQRSSRT